MNLLFQSYKNGQILAASLEVGLFTFLNVLILRDSVAVSIEALKHHTHLFTLTAALERKRFQQTCRCFGIVWTCCAAEPLQLTCIYCQITVSVVGRMRLYCQDSRVIPDKN